MRDLAIRAPSGLSVLLFPADDDVLAIHVRDALDDVDAVDAKAVSEVLVDRLNVVYPGLAVRLRDPLAGFGSAMVYLFRDGGVLSSLGGEDWVGDPGVARVVTDAAGTYIDVNDAAAALFGVPKSAIIGARAGAFTRPDARIRDADELWRTLAASGRLHSLAVVRRQDGADLRVEFVTVCDGGGGDRHVTWLRAVGSVATASPGTRFGSNA